MTLKFKKHFSEGLGDHKQMKLGSTPSENPKKFHFSLEDSSNTADNITLKFEVFFDYEGYKNTIIISSVVNGVQKDPTTITSPFPFSPSKPNVIAITRNKDMYTIDVDGEHLLDFQQQPESETAEWIYVYDDTTVNSFSVLPVG